MAKIESVRSDFYQLPLDVELSDSTHGAIPHFEFVTVRIKDSDGGEGSGYTYAVNSGAAAFHALIEGYLAPMLIGRDADEIEKLWQDMWWKVHYSGRGGHATSAISAVDIALWDLKARRAGAPLWRLLGGYDPKVPVYAGGIDLDFTIDALLAQADGFLAHGHRAIKMKAGRPHLREDIERVRRMREHLGDDFPLMVDANMRWSVDQAIRAARELAEFNLVWLEEPTIPDDIPGHVRVVREGRTPVATGENMHTLYEFQAMISAGGVTYPEPDVTNCGGVTVFRKIAAVAEAHNLPVTSHGAHDITLHLLAAAPNRTYMEVHGFSLDRFVAEPMVFEEGFTVAPERPGHGIELDWSQLEQYRR
ncbi:mandelate racemase/muconate lactonizing enzyme family protein [Planosporangium flavigriseum]|uniref:Racemase n=1 Tax=Planosporangium flavigriseum TaxID=373681 RepID=A0A8J3LQD4_9ACTN|nr:mandelate racemase/muconate lactonizing enzyme family protein [Planosporangium flavigriseum]NJC67466.1 mandelate racemase/muconate lactonizing enzyme family protein [Planosporangium flavigriseum]GIG75584.1 racemase [Planosporangium flavigriseum]